MRDNAGNCVNRKLQARAVEAAYSAVNAVLRAAARIRWPGARPAAAKRICVFRIGNIGDVVCALPAISSIRKAYPDSHLTLLTSPGSTRALGAAHVLSGTDWVDEIWTYHADDIDTLSKRWSLLRRLRARRFDVWIDLPSDLSSVRRQFRDMLFASLTGAQWARGWRIGTLKWAAQAQTEHLHFCNEVDRNMKIVRELGIVADCVSFPLARSSELTERVDRLLISRDLAAERLVAIAPEAKRPTNRWFPERFAEIGRTLVAKGYAVAVIGSQAESDACEKIASQIGARAFSMAGELSVAASCELLRRCELVVCVDSGSQHLAASVGTPCISLFSARDMPGKWHPYGQRNVVLQKRVHCHTCLKEECPNDNLCMREIRVDEVVRFTHGLLMSKHREIERQRRPKKLSAAAEVE